MRKLVVGCWLLCVGAGGALLSACTSVPKEEAKLALIVGAVSTNGTFSAYDALVRAAEREGLAPIVATDLMTDEAREALVARSSVVLIGGSISDDHFRRRYTNEVAFITSACRLGVPVVGICHGHQMINLAFGGTIGRMPTNRVNKVVHKGKVRPFSRNCFHEVTIEKGSRLYETVGRERLKVNSSHVCEVQRIGEGLRVVARADDGVVEAIEHEKHPVSGFQFHPETIGDLDEIYNRILKAAIHAR